MTARRFSCLALLVLSACAACSPAPATLDLIVRGGQVIDGTGQPAQRADVGIVADRIVEVGDLSNRKAGRVIDATGLVVAPGFIDVRGQSGSTLLGDGNGEGHLRQGITTEIIGEGGSPAFWVKGADDAESIAPFGLTFDWTGFNGYFLRLRERGTTINLGTFVPATAVRRAVIGMENRAPTADELSRMEAMVDQGMRDGAFGLRADGNEQYEIYSRVETAVGFRLTRELTARASYLTRKGYVVGFWDDQFLASLVYAKKLR